MPKRSAFVLLVIIVAAAFTAQLHFGPNWVDVPIDFNVFRRAALRPVGEIYAASKLPFVNPPSSLFLFKLFALENWIAAALLWLGVSLAVFSLAAYRLVGLKGTGATFLTLSAYKGVTLGQSAMLLGGLLLWAVQLPSVYMGALFGVVAVIKPQLVLFAPLAFIVRKDWAALISMATTGLSLVLASIVLFGFDVWINWVEAMSTFHNAVVYDDGVHDTVLSMAITPAASAEYFGLSPIPFLLAGLLLGVGAVLVAARKAEKEMLVGLIVGASILASPYAHVHDTIAMIPACFVLLCRGPWKSAIPAAFVFIGVIRSMPFALVTLALAVLWGRVSTVRSVDKVSNERAHNES